MGRERIGVPMPLEMVDCSGKCFEVFPLSQKMSFIIWERVSRGRAEGAFLGLP